MANRPFQKTIEQFLQASNEMMKDDGLLQSHLTMAIGYTLGADMPGMAAAISLASRRLFGDETQPDLVKGITDVKDQR